MRAGWPLSKHGVRASWRDGLGSRRRARVLARHIAPLIPRGGVVLDLGAGNGRLGKAVLDLRRDVLLSAVDIKLPTKAYMAVRRFDGVTLPHGDASVDAVLISDVLHHADDPIRLLREAVRIARHVIIIKDFIQADWFDRQTLRLIDWVERLPAALGPSGHYWSAGEWTLALQRVGAQIESWETDLAIYPWPASVLFGRSMHFVARLRPALRRA